MLFSGEEPVEGTDEGEVSPDVAEETDEGEVSPDVADIRPPVLTASEASSNESDLLPLAQVRSATPPARITRTALIPAGRNTVYQPRRLSYLCVDSWSEYLITSTSRFQQTAAPVPATQIVRNSSVDAGGK